MNAQALKDEGIDLERGKKAVDVILHSNEPAPAPKTRATRSDKGTKRPAKTAPEETRSVASLADMLDSAVMAMVRLERDKDRIDADLQAACARYRNILEELQGK